MEEARREGGGGGGAGGFAKHGVKVRRRREVVGEWVSMW